jgi:broad specificity phosphatase PhoE
MPRTTAIYLVRHGATPANLDDPPRLQGQTLDEPLAPLGREQARRAAEALGHLPIRAVYTSPLLRARETAQAIASPRALEPIEVPELTEVDVGTWQGMTWEEVRRGFPEQYEGVHDDPMAVPYLGGESFGDVAARALPALSKIALDHPGETIAVVGHNAVNRAVIGSILGAHPRKLRQSNGGINLLEFRPPEHYLVMMINGCLHLE